MPADDIREFWADTRKALNAVPMDAKLERWEPPSDAMQSAAQMNAYTQAMQANAARGWIGDATITYSRVTLSSYEGVRIRGWYMTPAEAAPAGGWPALLTVPGYSEVMGVLGQTLVRFGYAVLALFPRGQGQSRAEWRLEHSTKLTYNLLDRDRYYYRGAYMDCVRGVDFLCSRSEIDRERIGMFGISQGGGLTLATLSLDQRLRVGVAWIPFLCNYPVAVDLTSLPYGELQAYLTEHPDQRAQVLETLRWFDPLNLVDAIEAPTLVSIGGKDVVCPEATVLPVFTRIQARKSLLYLPELTHGSSIDHPEETKTWLDRYLR